MTIRSAVQALARAATVVGLAFAVAACGGGARSAGPTPTVPATSTAIVEGRSVEPYEERQPVFQLWFHRFHGPGPSGPGLGPIYYTLRTAEELDIPYTLDELGLRPALPVERMAELVLDALIAGPNRKEWAFGMETTLDDSKHRLHGITLHDGVASVDMASMPSGPRFAEVVMSQIVFTLTWFNEIEAVRIEVDGVPIAVPVYTPPDSGTELVDRPVSREDYQASVG